MIPEQLLKETFSDLVEKYDLRLDIKSKMKFNIYSLDDLPHDVKADISLKVKTITESIGRKRFDIDHPLIENRNDKLTIRSGIWSIRIF